MTQPSLCLSFLGPSIITLNNNSLDVTRKKATALLSYLSVTDQVQARDSLAALLWPESARARANLRQTLWTLNNALGDGWLEMDRQQVRLRSGYSLDVLQFRKAVAEAESVFAQGNQPYEPTRLEKAVALYRATFLAGFTLPDAPEFDAWQRWQAQQLEQNLSVALQLLIHAYKQEALWGRAIRHSQRWVELDPLNEAAQYELMDLYIAAGQKMTAMRQYEQYEQHLADELGVTPQDTLIELYQSLKRNGFSLTPKSQPAFDLKLLPDLPLHKIPLIGPLPPGSRMPLRPNPHFVGRQGELRQLARSLKIASTVTVSPALVAATGLGGIGKTQLAVEFAYRYGRFFPGGIFWLNSAEADALPDEIAQCGGPDGLALSNDFEQLPLKEQVKRVQQVWEEPVPRLLVFDNCEDMSLLDQWRPATGGCRVLVTSRRSRWDPALAVSTLRLDTLQRSQSIDLLCHFLPDLADEQDTADAIADELGDLPLALYLAGCFLMRYRHVVSPTAYLHQLRDQPLWHPSLLGKGTDYLPTAHDKQVARTLRLSYERLNPKEKVDQLALDLLARASYLALGELIPRSLLLATLGSNLEDAQAALMAEDGLLRLIELGLLEEKATGALRLHRLVAMIVQPLLGNDTVQQGVEEGVRTILQRKINISGYVGPIPQLLPHLRTVLASAVSSPSETMATLNKWYGKHLVDMGNYVEAQAYYERCLAIRKKLFGSNHPETATILMSLGNLHYFLDNLEAAQDCHEQALSIHEETSGSDHLYIAMCLSNIGLVYFKKGCFEENLKVLSQAINIFEKIVGPDHLQTAYCMNNLAQTLTELGKYEQARGYYEQTLAINKATLGKQHPYTAIVYSNIGDLLAKQGNWSEAIAFYEKAWAIFKQSLGAEHLFIAETLNGLGRVFHQLGDLVQARSILEQALKIRQQASGSQYLVTANILRDLGKLLYDMNAKVTAESYLNQAFVIYSKILGSEHYHTKALTDYISNKFVLE